MHLYQEFRVKFAAHLLPWYQSVSIGSGGSVHRYPPVRHRESGTLPGGPPNEITLTEVAHSKAPENY